MKTVIRGVAQLVAHLVWDQGVAGSNPVTPTTLKETRGTVQRCRHFELWQLQDC